VRKEVEVWLGELDGEGGVSVGQAVVSEDQKGVVFARFERRSAAGPWLVGEEEDRMIWREDARKVELQWFAEEVVLFLPLEHASGSLSKPAGSRSVYPLVRDALLFARVYLERLGVPSGGRRDCWQTAEVGAVDSEVGEREGSWDWQGVGYHEGAADSAGREHSRGTNSSGIEKRKSEGRKGWRVAVVAERIGRATASGRQGSGMGSAEG
jgi:hypothetical protein